MDGQVEFADRRRDAGVFPRAWGTPPDGVEERHRWALRHITERRARGLGSHAELSTPMRASEVLAKLAELEDREEQATDPGFEVIR